MLLNAVSRVLYAVSWVLPVVIGLVVLAAAFLTILFFLPGPSSAADCGNPPRVVRPLAQLADQFQSKWDALNADLDRRGDGRATFTESEVTSRAERFLGDQLDAPFDDVIVCFVADSSGGRFEATARTAIRFLPNRTVRAKGTVDLSGAVPVVTIDDMDIGQIFGFVLDWAGIKSALEDEINDQLATLSLAHGYQSDVAEASLGVTGAP